MNDNPNAIAVDANRNIHIVGGFFGERLADSYAPLTHNLTVFAGAPTQLNLALTAIGGAGEGEPEGEDEMEGNGDTGGCAATFTPRAPFANADLLLALTLTIATLAFSRTNAKARIRSPQESPRRPREKST